MYHEFTRREERQRKRRRVLSVLIVFFLAIGIWFAFNTVNESLREQGEVSMRNAILNSAKQCCAVEGAYPSSLAYLEQNYGLVVNRNDYTITYEVFAENVMPSVVVIAK